MLMMTVRQAVRSLRRSPGFVAVVMLSLIVGLTLTLTVFSVIEGAILRPPHYPALERLYTLQDPRRSAELEFLSLAEYHIARDRLRSYESVGAYRAGFTARRALRTNIGGVEAQGFAVTGSTLQVLGVRPVLGRLLLPADDHVVGEPPVVISFGLWKRHFGESRVVLGRTLRIDGVPHVIVGVMPPGFYFPFAAEESAFWTPLQTGALPPEVPDYSLSIIGRLKPGVSAHQAHSEWEVLISHINRLRQDPNLYRRPVGALFSEIYQASDAAFFYLLLGVVLCILVLASVNVTNLLMLRSSEREGEIAIRTALGASRGKAITPVLIEIGLLIGAALLLSVPAALLTARVLLGSIESSSLRDVVQIGLNPPLTLFAVALAGLTAIACAWGPVRLHRLGTHAVLQEAGPGTTTGRQRRRLSSVLVSAQVMLSLVLLTDSALLVATVATMSRWTPGFDMTHLYVTEVPASSRPSMDLVPAVLSSVSTAVGVRSAAAARRFIPAGGTISTAPGSSNLACHCQFVSVGFLETLHIPMRQGRGFLHEDLSGSEAAVVDERTAARLWPGDNPIGKSIKLGGDGTSAPLATVVGVTSNLDFAGPTMDTSEAPPLNVLVMSPLDTLGTATVFIRVHQGGLPIRQLRSALEDALGGASENLRIREVTAAYAGWLEPLRWYAVALGAFSIFGLGLAGVGLYGVMSSIVRQRAREIGIRIALGASPRDVMWLAARSTLRMLGLGLLGGTLLSMWSLQLVRAFVVDLEPLRVGNAIALAAVLGSVVVVAMAIPIRRILRVAPSKLLRP